MRNSARALIGTKLQTHRSLGKLLNIIWDISLQISLMKAVKISQYVVIRSLKLQVFRSGRI